MQVIYSMAKSSSGLQLKRREISYFEGVNSLVSSNVAKIQELSHAENARSVTIGSVEKRQGTHRLGNEITAVANYGIFFFQNTGNNGFYRVSKVGATTSAYYLSNAGVWTILAGGGTSLSDAQTHTTFAEGNCFIVNGTDVNRYITSDGVTVVVATTAATTNHLYNSPKANKINYYKNKLYVADYYVSTTRYQNGIQFSSEPVGLLSLIAGDHEAGACIADAWISVADTKYIYATDTVDIYRGDTKIADVTIKAKDNTRFQINAITFVAGYTSFLSSDEVWVDGTYTGQKVFRWATNSPSGTTVKQYDTFHLSGEQNDRIKLFTNIGNVMLIANNNNLAIWNNYALQNLDMGVGCVSDVGWVKSMGSLWFIHYSGIYSTSGDAPKLISSKIERYIQGATKAGLEAAAAGKKGLSVFFAIGDVTLYNADGSEDKTLEDVCLEFNIRQQSWFVHVGVDASQFATYIHSTNPDRLEFASTTAPKHIYEFLYSETDADNEIPFRIDSQVISLGSTFESICYPHQIIIETERGSGLQVFVSLDQGPFYPIKGEVAKGCTILKIHNRDLERNSPPRCRQIKFSIRDYTKKLCKITRSAILYSESSEEEEYRSNDS